MNAWSHEEWMVRRQWLSSSSGYFGWLLSFSRLIFFLCCVGTDCSHYTVLFPPKIWSRPDSAADVRKEKDSPLMRMSFCSHLLILSISSSSTWTWCWCYSFLWHQSESNSIATFREQRNGSNTRTGITLTGFSEASIRLIHLSSFERRSSEDVRFGREKELEHNWYSVLLTSLAASTAKKELTVRSITDEAGSRQQFICLSFYTDFRAFWNWSIRNAGHVSW